jgi:hypothetical protein
MNRKTTVWWSVDVGSSQIVGGVVVSKCRAGIVFERTSVETGGVGD